GPAPSESAGAVARVSAGGFRECGRPSRPMTERREAEMMFSMLRMMPALFVAGVALVPAANCADPQAPPSARSQNGKYVVRLRPLPPDGLFAQEDNDIEFFVGDTSRDDPIFGPAPVIRADIRGRFSMPAMPGMPEAVSQAHVEAQPGYYGVGSS